MTVDLRGRVAIVTGASRGVGRGLARDLGEAGATVHVTGRTVEEGTSATRLPGSTSTTAREVTELGGTGVAVRCDAGDDEQLAALVAQVSTEQGRLDVLVNSAWGGDERFTDGTPFNPGPCREQPLALWDAMHRIGVRAHDVTTALAAPLLIADGGGLVVSVSSFAGRVVVPPVPYGVAPAAIDRWPATPPRTCGRTASPRCRCPRGSCSPRACWRTCSSSPTSPTARRRCSSAAPSRHSPPTPTSCASPVGGSSRPRWRPRTASPTSTGTCPRRTARRSSASRCRPR